MSGIVPAMKLLRDVFDIYARKEGDSNTLSKKEAITLLQVMFPKSDVSRKDEVYWMSPWPIFVIIVLPSYYNFYTLFFQATNQAAQDKFFTNLENNGDVVVSFEEFVTFAATLSHLYVFSFFLCTYKLLTLD